MEKASLRKRLTAGTIGSFWVISSSSVIIPLALNCGRSLPLLTLLTNDWMREINKNDYVILFQPSNHRQVASRADVCDIVSYGRTQIKDNIRR